MRAGQAAAKMSAAQLPANNALISCACARVHCGHPPLAPSQTPAQLGWAYQHSEGQGAAAARCAGVIRLPVLTQLCRHPFHENRQQLQRDIMTPLDQRAGRGPSRVGTAEQGSDQVSRKIQARLRPGQRSQRAAAGATRADSPLNQQSTAVGMLPAEMPHTHIHTNW